MLTTQKKIPPKSTVVFGQQVVRNTFAALVNAPKKYPGILLTGLPGKRVYLVNHPDLAQHVLLKNHRNYTKGKAYELMTFMLGNSLVNNDGENWHKQRMLMQPAFHMESLKRISEIVTSSTNQLLRRWKAKENTTINFTREMEEVIIDIVTQSLFTTDVTTGDIAAIWRNINFLGESSDGKLRNPLAIPLSVPTPLHLKMRKCIAELNQLIFSIIDKRKAGKNSNKDLLQMLLESRYEETGTSLTNQQIRDEIITIFMAGYETTVNAISWSWYLLKKNKDEEEKLRAESLVLATGRDPVFEDVPKMIFGKQVINESLRMYPPATGIMRSAVEDDEMGGYFVPAGMKVAVNIAGIHYHPDYWESPDQFRPQRFQNFDLKGENRFVFLPFGGGPRICIGKNFAMMEMQIINAMISARVEMELVSQRLKPKALVTVNPGDGVMVRLKKVYLTE